MRGLAKVKGGFPALHKLRFPRFFEGAITTFPEWKTVRVASFAPNLVSVEHPPNLDWFRDLENQITGIVIDRSMASHSVGLHSPSRLAEFRALRRLVFPNETSCGQYFSHRHQRLRDRISVVTAELSVVVRGQLLSHLHELEINASILLDALQHVAGPTLFPHLRALAVIGGYGVDYEETSLCPFTTPRLETIEMRGLPLSVCETLLKALSPSLSIQIISIRSKGTSEGSLARSYSAAVPLFVIGVVTITEFGGCVEISSLYGSRPDASPRGVLFLTCFLARDRHCRTVRVRTLDLGPSKRRIMMSGWKATEAQVDESDLLRSLQLPSTYVVGFRDQVPFLRVMQRNGFVCTRLDVVENPDTYRLEADILFERNTETEEEDQ